jgi:hypothetical protein
MGEPTVLIRKPAQRSSIRTTGAVGSIQEAEITVDRNLLDGIWTADNLELIARGYWAFLRRISLGIIRVEYADASRTVTAFGRIPLLRFGAPVYEAADGSGRVEWPIDRGLLVASEGRGKGALRVSVVRCDRDGVDDEADRKHEQVKLIAKIEVENFYPGLRGRGRFARLGAWIYAQTQLRIHVLVCNGYLRHLPRLDFPPVDRTSMPSERVRPQAPESSEVSRA